jgi:HEAT repeat protein
MPEQTSNQDVAKTGEPQLDVDKTLAAAAKYRHGQDRGALYAIERLVRDVTATGQKSPLADRLAAMLGSEATVEAKGFFCKQLSIIGTQSHVPVLAGLLTDGQLSFMARYALERIGGRQVDQALREALPQTAGRTKVGLINSLGNRQDRDAVPLLLTLLEDADQEVVGAAAAALGRIGMPAAEEALARKMSTVSGQLKFVVADAYLACTAPHESTRPESGAAPKARGPRKSPKGTRE